MRRIRRTAEEARQHEVSRIIVGNQIAIMRALSVLAQNQAPFDLKTRVMDVKRWWRGTFGEEVGFSTSWGDIPPEIDDTPPR